MFGSSQDVGRLASLIQNNFILQIYMIVIEIILGLCSVLIIFSWFPRTHQVSKGRLFFVLMLSGVVVLPLQILVLNPVFQAAFEFLDRWLKYT
jgi:hypothetical protein